jgi:hypothetical protein
MAGEVERASRLVEEAVSAEWDGDPAEPDLEIVRGDVLLAARSPDVAGAEARFERAAALGEARGARISSLVAATRLADLRRGTPRDGEAYAALRSVYETFTEGFDIPQLVAARALLHD